MNEKITYEKLVCESCGKEFSCGVNAGKCWCFAVELKTETLAELREDFKGCLCKDCLEQLNNSPVSSNEINYGKKEKQIFKRQAH